LAGKEFMTDNSRKKFIIIAFAAGMSLGLLFTSLSFIDWQRSGSKNALLYLAASQAKLISSNVKCALSFSDAKDANGILESLKTQNYIVFAGIYDCNGNLFASYYRDGVKQQEFESLLPSKVKFTSHDGFLIISEPVILEHQLLGTVTLWAQL
jgi:uncharacterized membrane protein affecting hemolysin expression